MLQVLSDTFQIESTQVTDTTNSWSTIIDCIDAASKTIHIGAFLWRDDNLGNRVAESILNAAERGVRVTIEKDTGGLFHEWTEGTHQSLLHTSGNIQDYIGTILRRPKLVRQNRRHDLRDSLFSHPKIHFISKNKPYIDHAKVIVIDDILIQGGMNIGDEYDGKWIDFMTHMNISDIRKPVRQILSMPGILEVAGGDSSTYRVIRDIPSGNKIMSHHITEAIASIEMAREYITICGGYLCNDEIIEALIRKTETFPEMEIKIISAAQPNIQAYDMQKAISFLSKTAPSIEIIFSQDMIHAKVIQTEEGVLVGSGNFDRFGGIKSAEFGIKVSGNQDIILAFQEYFECIIDTNNGQQHELSKLFMERRFKNIVESYLQKLILKTNLLQPKY